MTPHAGQLRIDAGDGWLHGVARVESPNRDARPVGVQPDLIVVHGISLPPGEFGGGWIDRLFTNALPAEAHPYFAQIASLRVSAHVCVGRDGQVTQYVSFRERAWHAGISNYCGREACNDFSVGIELEGADTEPYDPRQYRVLADLVAALCRAYPSLSPQRVVGHSDIAPDRKSDPGPAFDWPLARRLIDAAARRAPAADPT